MLDSVDNGRRGECNVMEPHESTDMGRQIEITTGSTCGSLDGQPISIPSCHPHAFPFHLDHLATPLTTLGFPAPSQLREGPDRPQVVLAVVLRPSNKNMLETHSVDGRCCFEEANIPIWRFPHPLSTQQRPSLLSGTASYLP